MFTRRANRVPFVDGEPTNVQKLPFRLSYVSPIFPAAYLTQKTLINEKE